MDYAHLGQDLEIYNMSGEIRWAPFGSSEAEELLLGGYRVSVIATWPWLGHEFVPVMLGRSTSTHWLLDILHVHEWTTTNVNIYLYVVSWEKHTYMHTGSACLADFSFPHYTSYLMPYSYCITSANKDDIQRHATFCNRHIFSWYVMTLIVL